MEFETALSIINKYVEIPVEHCYDGLIVKKMEASNTLADNRRSNQTHIAITGLQMDLFPYVVSESYLNCDPQRIDKSMKNYFVAQVVFYFYRTNIEQFEDRTNFSFTKAEDYKQGLVSVWRRRDQSGSEQIQLCKKSTDEVFVNFRKLANIGDYMVIVKLKEKLEYDCFWVKADDVDDDFRNLNNNFYHLQTSTSVPATLLEQEIPSCLTGAVNRIFYGVPGSGKSHHLKKQLKKDNIKESVRVVFHPDYTYSDFVGQILPRVEGDKVKYVFTPGPFTTILKKAYEDPENMYALVIEELTRGNAPAIFGEIFQLLDRSEEENNFGESEYEIVNADVAEVVYGDATKKIKIPSNLSIYATMNTSDQNVFTLDTAFQRRWFMEHIPNKFEGAHAAHVINGSNITWGAFATVINKLLAESGQGFYTNEDKGLGAYFAKDNVLDNRKYFAEKVLKYLWDDAFKINRNDIFKTDEYRTLSDIIEAFENVSNGDALEKILVKDKVYDKMNAVNAEFMKESNVAPEATESVLNTTETPAE